MEQIEQKYHFNNSKQFENEEPIHMITLTINIIAFPLKSTLN